VLRANESNQKQIHRAGCRKGEWLGRKGSDQGEKEYITNLSKGSEVDILLARLLLSRERGFDGEVGRGQSHGKGKSRNGKKGGGLKHAKIYRGGKELRLGEGSSISSVAKFKISRE